MADEQIVTSIVAKADLSSLVSEVHRASSSLQQLQRELLASNKAISSSTKLANNLFRDTLTGSGQFSSHFVNLNSDVDQFGKNLDAGRLKLKNYFQTFREHTTTQKGMIRELAKEQVMLQNSILQPLGRNAQGLMQYNVMIPRGLDAVKNSAQLARMEMQIMNRALSEGAGSLINWGKNTQWAGRQLTVGLTVPLTMFGAAAGKAFREADAELVRLTKVYGGLSATSASDLKAIREEVIQTAKTLSKTMGASFKDTIALGADIAATGQTGNELLGSIAETTRLSILGEVDRQDAMKATLSIQTAFKQNTQQLTESINFLNAVENQTSTTLNDLVEAIPKAGPVIQQLGGSVKDLALYLTAMREGGISASEGANALKSGLASLINPTKQTVGMMSNFGINVMGMVAKNTGNTTGLLLDLQKALDGLDPLSKARAMEQMFGKFQFARMSALLNNLGKQGSQTLQVLDLMKASTSDLAAVASRELKMVTESASGKYKRAIEGLKAELADVGEEFLGVATKLITAATKILDFFTGLPTPIKKALTFLAGFTALVGPLIMLTGVLANFFGYITKGIVQLRAFFMKANGWKMLTPEIIAAQKAAEMVENAFYSDAAAAQVLHNALQKLVLDYQNLQAASAKNAVPVNPGISTVAGRPVVAAGKRFVDPTDPYVGDPNTRAMSHINPRDPNNPATIFGGVPGAMPVNRGISRTPQMYMSDRLPNIEGLTSVKGISTGIVPAEAAKFHALMATLGMQTEQEVAALKKTIAMGGTVSAELLSTFDDILPITQKFADSAATQSAAIVQQMRNAEITVEEAKARILALNAQIESGMGSAVSSYAAGRGRSIDLTRAPMMDQPVVDANGQFTLRDLYKKKANASVMEEFGRLRGVRTFGAPYSIQTTRPPRFNTGGQIESFGANKTIVSGPSSVNYDDRLGTVPIGGYVLNQAASMDPANAALVAMAPSTYLNDGGSITAALTPRETVFGPQIQRMPELYAAVDAANNGYNFGGQIMNGVSGYGKQTSKTPGSTMDQRLFRKQYKDYLRFINNPRYEDDMRIRMIMLDAAELSYTAKIPMDKAIHTATSNFDFAKNASGGSDENFVKIRIKQVQDLEKKHPELKVKNAKTAKTSSSDALNYNLNKVRRAMMKDPHFAGVYDLIQAISPTTFKNGEGKPMIQGLHDRAHFRRRGTLGYMTSGYMGLAAVMPSGINNIMSRLETLGLSRDVLNLNAADARENFALALKKTGMDRFATVDDLYAAIQDDGKFKSKAQILSGNVIRANKKQRDAWSMFLQAAGSKQKWIPGRPPRLVPSGFNLGGMIPGGHISSNRSSYGFVSPAIKLLAPDKQLKILQAARAMSKETATGSFKDMAPVKYGHMVAPSSGMSYPIPGVSGLYKDSNGKLKFFKGVSNEISAKAEIYGTRMAREVFGLESPEQTIKTILNPLDPSGKSKLLGLESPFDKKFASGGTKFSEDEMIRQTIASLAMNNKDLSPSNVFGNVLADVGAAGVFPKASNNIAFAESLPSMHDQAMINLLGVKGGARKDFAVNTSQIASGMTAKQYDRKMKSAMAKMYPKLVKFVAEIPKADRAPYVKLLKRFEAGMDTDFTKLHGVHVAAKRNSGGPIGGSIQRGRYSYGKTGAQRPGNPAARAAWEAEQRAQRERDAAATRSRAASHQVYGQQALTSGLGRQAVRAGTTSFYNPGQVMINNMLDPFKNSAAMKAQYLSAAFSTMATSTVRGATTLRYAIMTSGTHIKQAYKESAMSIINTSKALGSALQSRLISVAAKASALKNSVIQEQNAYAARNYMPGMAPAQGFFGPGYIGKYKDHGDGVQSRKVGSFGFRKREFLVNNESTGGHNVPMTAAQAKRSGIVLPRGGMGYGAQMGIGMAGSMAGMGMMSQEKVLGMSGMQAGMGVMVASSILPMLPFARMANSAKNGIMGVTKAVSALARGAATAAKVIAGLARFAKAFGPIGLAISTVVEGLNIYKKIQDSKQDATMGLGLTAKAAEQAGIKYFNLNEEMKNIIDNRKLLAAQAAGGENLSVGLPGLAMDVKQMKAAKEEGKKLKEVIESLNRSGSFEETLRLVNNQKAQYIAAGMSIEEANKKIYGALANSDQSQYIYKLLSNVDFAGITDKASAANFVVGNLINTLSKGADYVDFGKEIGAGFESLINVFNSTTAALVGTEDKLGNIMDQYDAYRQVLSGFETTYGKALNAPIGESAYNELVRSNRLLGDMTTKSDSIAGILAKWKLFSSGFKADLSKIDSDLAIKLAGFTASIEGSIQDLAKSSDVSTTYSTVQTALTGLQKTIALTSAANQRANNAAQRSANEELKIITKKIKLIEDEKNKKLEALRATQDASNYAIELQKLQIEYADAVSRGDMATANRAQLDINQLTLNRQTDLAQKAIEDAATKAKTPLEKKAESVQTKSENRSNAAAIAADNAAVAREIATTLESYQKRYNDLTVESINVKLLPPEQQKAAQAEVDRKLFALIKEIQASGTGNSLTAKTVREGFSKYFTANGKAIELQKISNQYVDGTLKEVKTVNTKILEIFAGDTAKALAASEAITGGVKIKQLRDDMVKALTRYEPNTPQGTKSESVLRPGTAVDYSTKAKSLNQAGKMASSLTGGGSFETYTRVNNDGMEEYFKVFKYKNKAYALDTNGNIYSYDYSAGTITDLYTPVGNANKKANGGIIRHFGPGGGVSGPGTATSDSIPAMLSDGEYVIKADSVKKYGQDTFDALNAQHFKVGGQPKTPRSKFPMTWIPYKPDMPNYWSDGTPSGSPTSQRWGALRYNPGVGTDRWGGKELSGHEKNEKKYLNDYWHQLSEQPSKSKGYGMSIPNEKSYPIVGSGASMSGIGNGVYGAGAWLNYANGGLVQGYDTGGIVSKLKNMFKLGGKEGLKKFGLGARAGATWQAMEEAEKFLSLKYGASENASGLEKWGKAVARFGWSALQGAAAGASAGGAPGFVGGAVAGTGEGLVGLIKDGSQFGVKGGSSFSQNNLAKRKDLYGYANSDGYIHPDLVASKDLSNMSILNSLGNIVGTSMITGILPGTSGLLGGAANSQAISRQGARVFDRSKPKFINDLMELGFMNPSKSLKNVNNIMTEFQEKAKTLAMQTSPILEGKGSVNLFGTRGFAAKNVDGLLNKITAFFNPSDRGINFSAHVKSLNNDVVMPIYNNTPSIQEVLAMPTKTFKEQMKRRKLLTQIAQAVSHNGSPDTLFHELGHRNLNILGGPQKLVDRTIGFGTSSWHGLHEGYADLFQNDAYKLLKGSPTATLTDRLGMGNTYATNTGRSVLEDILHRLSGGLNSGRMHQMGTEFLVPYTNMIKNRISVDTLKRLQDMAKIEGGPLQTKDAIQNLYSMLTQNMPKFEAGANMVPADMLAMIHKNEAVIPANMNPFNPNATSSAIASGSVYNINVELNGTTVTAKDVAMEIHKEMRIKEMAAGVNRKVGRP